MLTSVVGEASGDLRNVVKTIAELPGSSLSGGKLSVVINDWDFDVAARNAILLLIAFTEDESDAVDCILHVWFSAFTSQDHEKVLGRIYLMIKDVYEKVKDKPQETDLKRFLFGNCSVRLTLKRDQWKDLLSFLEPAGLSIQQAQQIRTAKIEAPDLRDSSEHKMFAQSPVQRTYKYLFRKEGILLPLSWPRTEYNVPNQ